MGKIIVGYWDFRGYVEPIRYLLHYKNIPYEDKRYIYDGTWEKEKYTLGLEFPNLPYYFDDDVKLTQSNTILQYLADKYDLGGRTKQEKLRVSLAEQQIYDFRRMFYMLLWNSIGKDFEEMKKEYFVKVLEQLNHFTAFLGNQKFLMGDRVTYIDFMLYDHLDHLMLFSKNILDGFSSIKAYCDRVKNLPELQAYFKSSSFKKWPIYLEPTVPWGNKGEMPQ